MCSVQRNRHDKKGECAIEITFAGKTAVIFGAGRGIGEAVALEIARAKAKVYVADIIKD